MKQFQKIFICLLFVIFSVNGCATSYLSKLNRKKRSENNIVVFNNVNVVAMTDDKIKSNQLVVIKDHRIQRISDANGAVIPADALVVEGAGKYLMPGLADMHVHINSKIDLFLLIAHGVTTVQNMWGYDNVSLKLMGFPDQLKLRDKVNKGEMLGPTIYTSGPILEGEPLTQPFMKKTVDEKNATKQVTVQKEKGYDFIKVYDHLTGESYNAIINTAKELEIPVKGHVPFEIGIDGVLSSGQISIDHLTGYIDPDAAEFLIPENAIDEYAARTRQANVWNCPTMVIWQKRVSPEKSEAMKKHPGMKYLNFMQRFFLKMSISAMQKSITYDGDYISRMKEIDFRMVKALRDADAKLILGTDCGNPFVFPGWSVHEELKYLVAAGLTPYEAILTGTKNAAEYLGKSDRFGTVEAGKAADLLLIDGNPLADVTNVSKISGVMVGGIWFSENEINNVLKKLQ